MSDDRSLRVALLHHSFATPHGEPIERVVRHVARALLDAGHRPTVLSSRPGPPRRTQAGGIEVLYLPRLPGAPLRFRGFDDPITHLPAAVVELRRGGYDVAHAFSPQDAWAAIRGPQRSVFTWAAVPTREELASRRLRLALVSEAAERSDVVLAPGTEEAAAVRRWLALSPHILDHGEASALERVYLGGVAAHLDDR